MIEEKFYKHSGKSSLPGFLIALGLGIFLAISLGFIYNSLIVLIPLIYINLFLCLGFGVLLGFSSIALGWIAKVRNTKQSLILSGIIGFIGFYFQWIAYFVFLDSGELTIQSYQDNFDLFYTPDLFIELILDVNKYGSWEMFGVVFKGFPLWGIWGIEALIIIGIPVLLINKQAISPFSENLRKWYRKHTLDNQFRNIATQLQFASDLMKDPQRTIETLSYGEPYRYSLISIYYLKDEQRQYLSAVNVHIGRDGKSDRTSIVHLLELETPIAEELIKKYGTKNWFSQLF
ncbi:MAG: hypothetical protein JXR03_17155 [Cyclobacteriaceae bacterium]